MNTTMNTHVTRIESAQPRLYSPLAAWFIAAPRGLFLDILTSLLVSILVSLLAGIHGYARPVDAVTGEITSRETLIRAPEILINDRLVLQSVPEVRGMEIQTIGDVILTQETTEALQAAIQTYTDEEREVSFLVLDLMSGNTIYCNTGRVLYSASCIKAPYIISCLAAGNAATDDMYMAGHISDNDAYRRIRELYGRDVFEQWLSACDVNPELARRYYCHLNAIDLSQMWLAMYPYIVGDETESQFARRTLQGSLNSVIAAGPGSTRTAYSKAGWISNRQMNDYNVYNCGGIVMDRNPYIVVILSNVPGTTQEAQALIDILDIAHQEMAQ